MVVGNICIEDKVSPPLLDFYDLSRYSFVICLKESIYAETFE